VVTLVVAEGDTIPAGDTIGTIEAMKMEAGYRFGVNRLKDVHRLDVSARSSQATRTNDDPMSTINQPASPPPIPRR
jgi:acetyl/propionyl-CoA carboxylase alpha subunit